MIWNQHKVENVLEITNFYTLFFADLESDFRFLGEMHDFWECMYIISGELSVSADEKVYELKKGNIIFHKPLEMHKFSVNSDKAKILVFTFDMKGKITEFFKEKVFSLSAEQEKLMEEMRVYLEHNAVANNNMMQNRSMYIFREYGGRVDLPTLATYILRLFYSLYGNAEYRAALTEGDAVSFFKVVKFLEENIKKSLSVEEIAASTDLSESGVKRIFRKYAGMGVHEYFVKMKIRLSRQYLDSGMTVTETAEALGFSSQSYFSGVFKRETGFSPSRNGK